MIYGISQTRGKVLLQKLKRLWWAAFWILLVAWVAVALIGVTGAINTAGPANEGYGYVMIFFLFVGGWILAIMFLAWLFWGLVGLLIETFAKEKV